MTEREIYQFIGEVRATMKAVEKNLEKIEKRLDEGNGAFSEIREACATMKGLAEANDERSRKNEERISSLENREPGDLSKRRRLQIDTSSVATALLVLWEFIKGIFGL